jgi:hypothetical protein
MKITIAETNEVKTLVLPCPKTGIDCAADFINGRDITIIEDDCGDSIQTMTADAFAWWSDIITKQVAVDQRVMELAEDHGYNEVMAVVYEVAGQYDLEDEARNINAALDREFGAQAA